eukprot:683412-Pelagomonas_calceolata.AAC.1
MQKFGDPPAAIVEEIGGSINQPGLFPGDSSFEAVLVPGLPSLKLAVLLSFFIRFLSFCLSICTMFQGGNGASNWTCQSYMPCSIYEAKKIVFFPRVPCFQRTVCVLRKKGRRITWAVKALPISIQERRYIRS